MMWAWHLLNSVNEDALAQVCDRQVLRNAWLVRRVSFLEGTEPLDAQGRDGPAACATAQAEHAVKNLELFRQATKFRERAYRLSEFMSSCGAVASCAYRATPGRSWEGPYNQYTIEQLFLDELRRISEGQRLRPVPPVTQPLSRAEAMRIAQESQDEWDARERAYQREQAKRAHEWRVRDEEREYMYDKIAELNALPGTLDRLYSNKAYFDSLPRRW